VGCGEGYCGGEIFLGGFDAGAGVLLAEEG